MAYDRNRMSKTDQKRAREELEGALRRSPRGGVSPASSQSRWLACADTLCRLTTQHEFLVLLHGFDMFYPNCALRDLTLALLEFSRCNYSASKVRSVGEGGSADSRPPQGHFRKLAQTLRQDLAAQPKGYHLYVYEKPTRRRYDRGRLLDCAHRPALCRPNDDAWTHYTIERMLRCAVGVDRRMPALSGTRIRLIRVLAR